MLLLFFFHLCLRCVSEWCLTTLSSVRCTKAAVSSVTNLGEIKVYHHTIVLFVLHLYVCSESFQWISNNCSKCSSSNRNNSLATLVCCPVHVFAFRMYAPYTGHTQYKQCIRNYSQRLCDIAHVSSCNYFISVGLLKNVEHLKIRLPIGA